MRYLRIFLLTMMSFIFLTYCTNDKKIESTESTQKIISKTDTLTFLYLDSLNLILNKFRTIPDTNIARIKSIFKKSNNSKIEYVDSLFYKNETKKIEIFSFYLSDLSDWDSKAYLKPKTIGLKIATFKEGKIYKIKSGIDGSAKIYITNFPIFLSDDNACLELNRLLFKLKTISSS